MEEQNKLDLFEGKKVRSIWHEGELHFSVIDIVEVLTESPVPRKYWNNIKTREPQLSSVCGQLKMVAADGKTRATDTANRQGVLRILMSVPSPKAEPFKLWMAQIADEHIEEIGDPELGFDRLKGIYEAKGYSKEWIERRMQTIEVRKQLTDEWKNRGVKEGQDYAILTAEIAKATFGLTPSEHSKFKGLERQNLRDHMTPLELIFTALGEEATRMNTISDDAQGFQESHEAAQRGGHAAGDARLSFEKRQNQKVVSSENYLKQLGKDSKED